MSSDDDREVLALRPRPTIRSPKSSTRRKASMDKVQRWLSDEQVDEEPLIPRHVTVDTLPSTELEKSEAPPSQQDDSRAAAATSAKVWTWRISRCAVLPGVVLCIALFALSRAWPTISTHGLALTSCLRRSWLDPEQDLTTWIRTERKFATKMMLRNIGPIAGAKEGLVIASPSWGQYEDEPDYYYTWTRDSALTYSTLLADFLPARYLRPWDGSASTEFNGEDEGNVLLEPLLREYIRSQADLQVVDNPSGTLWTGGLNEPKFQVDGSAFEGPWGRPQRDGPALRALAIIPYANYLLDRAWPADLDYVAKELWHRDQLRALGSIIKNDLEEVGGTWWKTGFDLWEEVDGHHLFTLLAAYRALQAGSSLAMRVNDTGAGVFYSAQAGLLHDRLQDFYDQSSGYWRANLPPNSLQLPSTASVTSSDIESDDKTAGDVLPAHPKRRDRTGLDCAFLLSLIHFGDDVLNTTSPDVLSTIWHYVKSFDGLYALNRQPWTSGWAVGRYAEDVYNGVGTSEGNPWFICTFSFAQVLYAVQHAFLEEGIIQLHNLSIPFWADMLGVPSDNLHESTSWVSKGHNDKLFVRAIRRLGQVGDAFMGVGKTAAVDGHMSEQISRYDGSQVGARDLTWSYASFIEAARARMAAQKAAKETL